MILNENDFIEILRNYDDLSVNKFGANPFDNLVLGIKEDKELEINVKQLIGGLIVKLFELDEKCTNGLLLLLNQGKLTDNEILLLLNNESEKNIENNPKTSGLILRFIGSINSSLINKSLILSSSISEYDFWLWIDLLFRIDELHILRLELTKHFNSASSDFHLLMQRIIYWKGKNNSQIVDIILDEVYSFLPFEKKGIFTDLIDNILPNANVKINRFSGIEFIGSNLKTQTAKITE